MCFIDSNMFLYTLYSVSLSFVLVFKNFTYSFWFFFLEDFLMPFVIQGLNCLCGFNFTLIFRKHSLYKERKISRNVLYASLTFRKILILFQSILRNYCLNHSHKKRKDSLETRAVVQNFNNKLEFLWVVFNYMQGFSQTWRWRTRNTCIWMTLMLF